MNFSAVLPQPLFRMRMLTSFLGASLVIYLCFYSQEINIENEKNIGNNYWGGRNTKARNILQLKQEVSA